MPQSWADIYIHEANTKDLHYDLMLRLHYKERAQMEVYVSYESKLAWLRIS